MTFPVYADNCYKVLGVYLTSFLELPSIFFKLLGVIRVSLPGDHMPGVPPVPISNTAVKPRAANGSRTIGPARVGCCQVYSPALRKKSRAFFFIDRRRHPEVEKWTGFERMRPIDDPTTQAH